MASGAGLGSWTAEKWETVLEVVSGGDEGGVSAGHAARRAGVSVAVLRGWLRRSRERREEDEPWVWELAEAYDEAVRNQAGVLEDTLWRRAMSGVEEVKVTSEGREVKTRRPATEASVIRMISARETGGYSKGSGTREVLEVSGGNGLTMSSEDLYRRFVAARRMEALEAGPVAVPETLEARGAGQLPEGVERGVRGDMEVVDYGDGLAGAEEFE